MDRLQKIEIHYYLPDGIHSIDAMMRNKCESDFLAIFSETVDILGLDIQIEAEALAEGGVRELWTAIGNNNNQITLMISIIALVFAIFPDSDNELSDLQKEESRLSIVEKN